ncbi:hypothetical protein CM240_0411 [Clostridium bornimense]|uniref:Uncharacterized protein n=1 Tax=Clostridium bornimense TaxID=1216932 RepID=W6RTG9_9CLOT|nr:DUF5692 family protein [Clostridium bornimense]CDM67578.1 hypothetical protein CM240_0411 [Clostridium bornimense]
MFLFDNITWYSAIMWFVVLFILMLINEVARRSKWFSIFLCVILPMILTIFVWPKTAGEDSSTGTWFHWVKVYSALAGCLGFMGIRYIKGWKDNRYILMFPAIILAINMLEAVIRDFQCFGYAEGIVDGVWMVGGPWNILNGIAGILNILTISGWLGIFVGKDKNKDMLWPDQLWFWIIAYDIWNFAYVYNCVSDHSFYAGAALLISCTIPALFIKKGAWIQHRAYTLAAWMMFTMSFPNFVQDSIFAVQSSHNTTALFIVSLVSFIVNVIVFVYHYYKIFKYKRNPFNKDVHTDLKDYKEIVEKNK